MELDPFELFDESSKCASKFEKLQLLMIKNNGNRMMREKQYCEAIELYTEAIHPQRLNGRVLVPEDVAALWSNRSAAYIETGDFDKALQDAECCISADPIWFKGYIRKADAYEHLGKMLKCAHAHIEATRVNNMQLGGSRHDIDINVFMYLRITALRSLQKLYKTNEEIACSLLLDIMDIEILPLFRLIMEILIEKKLFEIIIFLHNANQLQRCEEKPRTIGDLLEPGKWKWDPFQEDAVICCFKSGILPISDIPINYGGHGLYFFILTSAISGSTQILEYMLKDIFTTKQQCEILDEDGLSIIHNLFDCKTKVKSKYIFEILICLSNYPHINLLMADKDGLPVTKCHRFRQNQELRQELQFCAAHARKDSHASSTTAIQNGKRYGKKKLVKADTTGNTVKEGSSNTLKAPPRNPRFKTFNNISDDKEPEEHTSKYNKGDAGNKFQLKTTSEPSSETKSDNDGEIKVVKILIRSLNITMEANISQLPNILHKLGVINLI